MKNQLKKLTLKCKLKTANIFRILYFTYLFLDLLKDKYRSKLKFKMSTSNEIMEQQVWMSLTGSWRLKSRTKK